MKMEIKCGGELNLAVWLIDQPTTKLRSVNVSYSCGTTHTHTHECNHTKCSKFQYTSMRTKWTEPPLWKNNAQAADIFRDMLPTMVQSQKYWCCVPIFVVVDFSCRISFCRWLESKYSWKHGDLVCSFPWLVQFLDQSRLVHIITCLTSQFLQSVANSSAGAKFGACRAQPSVKLKVSSISCHTGWGQTPQI